MTSARPAATDAELLARVRAGDDTALDALVDAHHAALGRFVAGLVKDSATREDVVQGTWAAAIDALESFGGRASFRTWLFTIALNRVRTTSKQDARLVAFSALGPEEADDGPALSPDHFVADGHWARPVRPWEVDPERQLELAELRALVDRALETLAPAQRTVLTLRDIEGLDSGEVCNVMGITESNQRVLLHRARTRVRAALNDALAKGGE